MAVGRKSVVTRGINPDSKLYPDFVKLAKRIRENIRRLRIEKGLTQEQMQDYEINLRQYQRIEAGETQNMTLANLFKIVQAFKITVAELFEERKNGHR